jgi:large subunit ribosomal protein L5
MTNKRFKDLYHTEVIDKLKEVYRYKNPHSIPKIKSIVLNMGVGKNAVEDSKSVDAAIKDLSLIAGQKPCYTKAKKSIAAFKLRKGMKIGCKVTLRGDRMYEFLERLIYTALPRVEDFRGFSMKNFDRFGNLNFGIKEQTVFPEVKYDEIFSLQGLNVSIVINSKTSEESKTLLSSLNFPFTN